MLAPSDMGLEKLSLTGLMSLCLLWFHLKDKIEVEEDAVASLTYDDHLQSLPQGAWQHLVFPT
jgi:hypothetical protein